MGQTVRFQETSRRLAMVDQVLPAGLVEEAGTMIHEQRGDGWTLVLRRQPARIVDGQPEGGYTDDFELICCDCGDDPGLGYREVSPRLQLVRGPYPIAAGITAYGQHRRLHERVTGTRRPGAMRNAS